MTMLRVPPDASPCSPLPHFPPPCALFNEDSPMQLKILASCCYCMTNRATVIPHGLSFLLQEAEEMEKYTRVPVARETDIGDCVRVCVFVFVCVGVVCVCLKKSKTPSSQQVMERGREENQWPKNMESELIKWLWLHATSWIRGFCVHPPKRGWSWMFYQTPTPPLTPPPFFSFLSFFFLHLFLHVKMTDFWATSLQFLQ